MYYSWLWLWFCSTCMAIWNCYMSLLSLPGWYRGIPCWSCVGWYSWCWYWKGGPPMFMLRMSWRFENCAWASSNMRLLLGSAVAVLRPKEDGFCWFLMEPGWSGWCWYSRPGGSCWWPMFCWTRASRVGWTLSSVPVWAFLALSWRLLLLVLPLRA